MKHLIIKFTGVVLEFDVNELPIKEIINYWNLSGLSIVMEGYGVTYEQSHSAYSLVDKNDQIVVKLHNINYVEENIEDLEVIEE